MPVRYRIDHDLGVVFSRWEGVVTMEEARGHYLGLKDDPAFDPDMRHFSDARKTTQSVASDDVRRLAKMNPFSAATRRAIIVADDALYGVYRMYEAQVEEPGTVGVFRDAAEALAWLGLPPDLDPELRESGLKED